VEAFTAPAEAVLERMLCGCEPDVHARIDPQRRHASPRIPGHHVADDDLVRLHRDADGA
jgi:hypothetical protein